MVKVFFNNSCNICRTEINHYKKHCNDNIKWVDVTNNQEAQKLTSKSYRDLLDLIINSSLLYSGYSIIKPVEFSKKVINVVMVGLDLYDIDNNDNKINNKIDTNIKNDNVETIDVTQID